MPELGEIAQKVRSKNAGPFWVTIDIFCGTETAFRHVCNGLDMEAIAAAFGTPTQLIKRFDIDTLNVVKISIPRPKVQGMADDRDMHGAAWAVLLAEMEID